MRASGKQPQEVGYFMTEVENQEDFSHYVGALNVKRATFDLESDAQRMISWSEKWPRMRCWLEANQYFSLLLDTISTHEQQLGLLLFNAMPLIMF